jgi:hypothetical protein
VEGAPPSRPEGDTFMYDSLLGEILDKLHTILRFPKGFSNNPETVSWMVQLLIPIIMAIETGEPLKACDQRMVIKIGKATENVP